MGKVETVCTRNLEEVQKRETDALTGRLLAGGLDSTLDARRAELASVHAQESQRLFVEFAPALAKSDHLPVWQDVSLADRRLTVSTWNCMELPRIGVSPPMLDGVSPYCDQLLRVLNRKGTEARQMMLDAMSSERVIAAHIELVLQSIHDALHSQGADLILLQEVNTCLKTRVLQLCHKSGWHACFSSGKEDTTKCCAMTGIISRGAFDEQTEVQVQEHKKVRSFAAVRQGQTWVVSCHIPLPTGKDPEANEIVGARVLRQLATRFFLGEEAHCGTRSLVVGGDWNADIRSVYSAMQAEELPAGCKRVSLHAPACPTCFDSDVDWPIDGALCLQL